MKRILAFIICCLLAQTGSSQWQLTEEQKREIEARPKMPEAQQQEMLAMVGAVNRGSWSLACRTAVVQKMLEEANYFSDRLNLPTRRPIQITDIQYSRIAPPWFSVIHNNGFFPVSIFTTNIYNASIPREARLHALQIGVSGTIQTTNFEFGFGNGRLLHVERLSDPETEYYAHDLDKLVGQPPLIDTNGAYQLATQWLSAVDMDMTALGKLKWTVNQLHYLARGATNAVTLPLFYVDFGSEHFPASGNLKAFDEPLVEVEILGTTKELQELTIGKNTPAGDVPYDHRPLLLITNALDLIRTPNPPVRQLQSSPSVQTNSPSP